MPMLDAFIPEGAFDDETEQQLLVALTGILLKHEGADPANSRARSLAWVFLHRPADLFVAGTRSELPRYRIIASVPEGQLDAQHRASMVQAVTEAVLDAEPDGRPRDAFRVWVFTNEIPEGTWGAGGHVFGLADIAGFVLNDAEAGRAHAKRRLAIAKADRNAVLA
jgi:phenylpyruvate tautomerase PptA (4-oxalocrotonate tautomerase family)